MRRIGCAVLAAVILSILLLVVVGWHAVLTSTDL
jgi:hypothetical protein